MTLEHAEHLKLVALKYGPLLLGLVLIGATIVALKKGETWGGTGKGRVLRSEDPLYSSYMIIARLVVGAGCVFGSLILFSR